MRATRFALGDPENITPAEADFTTWRYALVCADGAPVNATVRVSGTAELQARRYPGFCRPGVFEAVSTLGRSVIETRALDVDDPQLTWVVQPDGVVPDSETDGGCGTATDENDDDANHRRRGAERMTHVELVSGEPLGTGSRFSATASSCPACLPPHGYRRISEISR